MTRKPMRTTWCAMTVFTALAVGCVSDRESTSLAAIEAPSAEPVASPSPRIEPSTSADPHRIDVNLVWGGHEERDLLRKVGDRVITDDADLEAALREAKASHTTDDGPAYVFLDAHGQVPWKDVVTVVNTCSRIGIKRMEFGFGKRE